MNTHCELCGRKFFGGEYTEQVAPLMGGSRFCVSCAIKACETKIELQAEINRVTMRLIDLEIDGLKKDAEIARLRDALKLIEGAGGHINVGGGVFCDGSWCAEQARRARENE